MSQISIFDSCGCKYTLADYYDSMKRLAHAYNEMGHDRYSSEKALAYLNAMREKEEIFTALKEKGII